MCQWAKKVEFRVVDDNSMGGCVDFRRYIVRQYDSSITDIIFLDSDIYFHTSLLAYLLESVKNIQNTYYIVTPHTVKLWDYTWDVLTHPKFKDCQYGFEKTFDATSVPEQEIGDVGLVALNTFKFGGGWFNIYCAELWRFVDVPDELGPYGSEDTLVMWASDIMKSKGYDVQQYILSGQYICENYLYKSPYAKDLKFKSDKTKLLQQANLAMPELLNKFKNRI